MTQGIYCYVDKKTNEIVYVGKDSYIHKNSRHCNHYNKHHYYKQPINKILQNNPNRYKYKILEKGNISKEILNALEMSFIQKYNPKFNFTKGGEGQLGFHHSEETKLKISKANRGRIVSQKTRKKISEAQKKRVYSEEEIKRITSYLPKNQKGKNHPIFGKKHLEESKKKMSISKAFSSNSTGYWRVSKHLDNRYKNGFRWRYNYRENNKKKSISSVDIKKLEKKVKEKGLPWFKLDEV